jgi:hypothetical protein
MRRRSTPLAARLSSRRVRCEAAYARRWHPTDSGPSMVRGVVDASLTPAAGFRRVQPDHTRHGGQQGWRG